MTDEILPCMYTTEYIIKISFLFIYICTISMEIT